LKKFNFETLGAAIVLAAVQLSVAQLSAAHAAWEPSRQVQIIVPAGPGGGADQMVCIIEDIITKKKVADRSWSDVATCRWQGLNVECLMLRGIFMPPGATKEQVDYYVDLSKKVSETSEWKGLMKEGAFKQTFMAGDEYVKWVEVEEKRHQTLMKEAGFLAN
jgi:putative tricarboxylic transport membrane protein